THPSVEEYQEFLHSRQLRSQTIRNTGASYFGMLRKSAMGTLLAYDVMSTFQIIKRDLDVIFPSQSLVQNVGLDGSGAHCGQCTRFNTSLYTGPEVDWSEIPEDSCPKNIRETAKFYGSNWRGRLKLYSKLLRKRLDLTGHPSTSRLEF
ncbi:MAG: hypothetical protein ACQKBU_06870, partial [Verrucomicrobiales bacterium]